MNALLSVDMPLIIVLKWTVLLLVFMGFAIWLSVENRALKTILNHKEKHPVTTGLAYQSRMRSWMFLLTFFLFCVTVAVYDIRIEKLSGGKQADIDTNIPIFAQPMQEIPESVSPTPPVPLTVTESIFAPGGAGAPEEREHSAKLDELKARYEELLVTFLYLHQCKEVTESDYEIIMQRLDAEMRALEASPSLRENILVAAKGSYNEIYSGSACIATTLDPVKAGFKAFIGQQTSPIPNKTVEKQ